MIFAATLAALTLSPVVVNDKVIAYTAKADMAGTRRTVIVLPKHARALADAIQAGAGQKLVVRRDGNRNVLVSSQDETLKASLIAADGEDRAAKRAADPLGYALGDLAWAEQMLACARADFILHDDTTDSVEKHEAQVARLKTVVSDLSASV